MVPHTGAAIAPVRRPAEIAVKAGRAAAELQTIMQHRPFRTTWQGGMEPVFAAAIITDIPRVDTLNQNINSRRRP